MKSQNCIPLTPPIKIIIIQYTSSVHTNPIRNIKTSQYNINNHPIIKYPPMFCREMRRYTRNGWGWPLDQGLKKLFCDLCISNERGERVCYGETGIVLIWWQTGENQWKQDGSEAKWGARRGHECCGVWRGETMNYFSNKIFSNVTPTEWRIEKRCGNTWCRGRLHHRITPSTLTLKCQFSTISQFSA